MDGKVFFNVKHVVGDNIVFEEDFVTKTNKYYIQSTRFILQYVLGFVEELKRYCSLYGHYTAFLKKTLIKF
eukprot:snap_masked-scaffold_85-processed-gene-0.6-mRNA-1 protein AED:1.00 eAED:1.00 QI:0/0/0/0/1/1/2/0/70